MNPTKQIGEIIKAKRTERKMFQKQLAILAFNDGMYQGFISRIEKGEVPVKLEDACIILNVFDIDLIGLIQNAK